MFRGEMGMKYLLNSGCSPPIPHFNLFIISVCSVWNRNQFADSSRFGLPISGTEGLFACYSPLLTDGFR